MIKTCGFRALVGLTLAAATVSACGIQSQPESYDSQVQFVKTSANKALLESRDLSDTFLFGLNIIEVKGFFSTALNLNFRPVETKLKLVRSGASQVRLQVQPANLKPTDEAFAFMSYDVQKLSANRYEVDFGSVGNEIELYNQLGASIQTMNQNATPWRTVGRPQVVSVSQDANTIVADVLHTLRYTATNDDGQLQTKSGSVKVRIYLKRQTDKAPVNGLTVGQARALRVGFFPSGRAIEDEMAAPIARYKVDTVSRAENQIVVYLKDFPADFQETAAKSILSWNAAFGFNAIQVKLAPAGMDLGDPRYHVVKWFNGLDKDVPWAGYAPTNTNPVSGYNLNAQILINGDLVAKNYTDLAAYTQKVAPELPKLSGRIGNVPVVEGAGETPVVSFFSDPKLAPKDYIQGYYYAVISHEFGHSLGLRHNFLASTKLDPDQNPSSVMDYEPNWSSPRRKEVGSYDRVAIRLGYFNEKPAATSQHVFCTDEDIEKRYDCNQSDFGDVINSTAATLLNGTAVMSSVAVLMPGDSKPMGGAMKNAFKILDLISQVPASRQAEAKALLTRALNSVRDIKPDASLTGESLAIATKNIARVKSAYSGVISELNASRPDAVAAFLAGLSE